MALIIISIIGYCLLLFVSKPVNKHSDSINTSRINLNTLMSDRRFILYFAFALFTEVFSIFFFNTLMPQLKPIWQLIEQHTLQVTFLSFSFVLLVATVVLNLQGQFQQSGAHDKLPLVFSATLVFAAIIFCVAMVRMFFGQINGIIPLWAVFPIFVIYLVCIAIHVLLRFKTSASNGNTSKPSVWLRAGVMFLVTFQVLYILTF